MRLASFVERTQKSWLIIQENEQNIEFSEIYLWFNFLLKLSHETIYFHILHNNKQQLISSDTFSNNQRHIFRFRNLFSKGFHSKACSSAPFCYVSVYFFSIPCFRIQRGILSRSFLKHIVWP